jgi:hypothetical protein
VIAGDLNVVEQNHDPRYAVFGEWEYDFYRAFGRAGFEDAFRTVSRNQPELEANRFRRHFYYAA